MVWVLCVYAILLTVVIGFDLIVYLYSVLSCYHIGKWESDGAWYSKIASVTRKWAVKTPRVSLRDDNRYLLLDIATGKGSKKMVQSWQTAGCLLGLSEDLSDENVKAIESTKQKYIGADGNWIIEINKVDYAMLAYAILKNENDPSSVKGAMDKMLECILDNKCVDGLISYSAGPKAERRYVDTLGFVCPFLALYGRVYNKPEYVELSVNQIKEFSKVGISHGLPVHSYQYETGIPLGLYGWGRGAGWYSLGLIDLYSELADGADKDNLKLFIKAFAESVKEYERDDLGFSCVLQTNSRYDSSATAMLGYFFARAAVIFDSEEYYLIAKRCVDKLKSKTKLSGIVDECQGDTKDIGVFSMNYSKLPFAQGMTMRLSRVLSLYKN